MLTQTSCYPDPFLEEDTLPSLGVLSYSITDDNIVIEHLSRTNQTKEREITFSKKFTTYCIVIILFFEDPKLINYLFKVFPGLLFIIYVNI